MSEEKVCTQGHVIDTGKDVCQRCGASPVVPVVAEEAVAEESVDNELSIENEKVADEETAPEPELENVPENGSTEPKNTPEEPLADQNIQEGPSVLSVA